MLIAIRIDVVVVVIDRVHERVSFMHFVGMPIYLPGWAWPEPWSGQPDLGHDSIFGDIRVIA